MRRAARIRQSDHVDGKLDSALIQHRCVSPDHRQRAEVLDRVFIQGGRWAYCEAGKLAPDHTLLATGGVSRERLERAIGLKRSA
jgi:hypothetical protein